MEGLATTKPNLLQDSVLSLTRLFLVENTPILVRIQLASCGQSELYFSSIIEIREKYHEHLDSTIELRLYCLEGDGVECPHHGFALSVIHELVLTNLGQSLNPAQTGTLLGPKARPVTELHEKHIL